MKCLLIETDIGTILTLTLYLDSLRNSGLIPNPHLFPVVKELSHVAFMKRTDNTQKLQLGRQQSKIT